MQEQESYWKPIRGVTVVGITGAARHGKDDLAKALLHRISGAERWALSDAVAVVARVYHGMDRRDPHVLQAVGTAMRLIDPSVWLRCVYGAIADKQPRVAIVTGVRYPEEAHMIRTMSGAMVGIRRVHAPAVTDRNPEHEVESQIEAVMARCDITVDVPEYPDPAERVQAFRGAAIKVAEAIGL